MDELTRQEWDVIVIGTGIGGGTAGRHLAEAGLSVLFVEKGPDLGDAPCQHLASTLMIPKNVWQTERGRGCLRRSLTATGANLTA
ncbi:FAD-dependent oxidoreductase [Paracoccus kondratievae]